MACDRTESNESTQVGKPFGSELGRLSDCYRWATAVPIDAIVDAVRACSSLPLMAVGSGGSFTTAEFASLLHREGVGAFTCVLTPMASVSAAPDLRAAAVFLATAGGRNPDVLGAFEHILAREPRRFVVLCTTPRSPLSRLAARYRFVDFIEAEPPSGRDGFLATNSVLASAVLLTRAYGEVSRSIPRLPPTLADLIGFDSPEAADNGLHERLRPLWERETLVVLHGPSTGPAVVDLESKFSEAALGNVRAADFRSFAHGRHHWLAKRAESTAILALVTQDEAVLAHKTLANVPPGIPVVRLEVPFTRSLSALSALVQGFFVTNSAGRARGIDPGRPGVPGFGRRIYHLRAFGNRNRSASALGLAAEESVAIERKSRRAIRALAAADELQTWREAYAAFVRRLANTTFSSLVLDYDGTLSDEDERQSPLRPDVSRHIVRLLSRGVGVGVATGRGKSVRERLRERIPRRHWQHVVVGYYNGGDVAVLADDDRPDGRVRVPEALAAVGNALDRCSMLARLGARIEPRTPQITVEPKSAEAAETVWTLLQQIVHRHAVPGTSLVRSTHSIDVLAPGVDKATVVRVVAGRCRQAGAALCIGDRGQWPGNDFSLLGTPYSLSVDEVPLDPVTCWNLAPLGFRGVQATLEYLTRLKITRTGAFTIDLGSHAP